MTQARTIVLVIETLGGQGGGFRHDDGQRARLYRDGTDLALLRGRAAGRRRRLHAPPLHLRALAVPAGSAGAVSRADRAGDAVGHCLRAADPDSRQRRDRLRRPPGHPRPQPARTGTRHLHLRVRRRRPHHRRSGAPRRRCGDRVAVDLQHRPGALGQGHRDRQRCRSGGRRGAGGNPPAPGSEVARHAAQADSLSDRRAALLPLRAHDGGRDRCRDLPHRLDCRAGLRDLSLRLAAASLGAGAGHAPLGRDPRGRRRARHHGHALPHDARCRGWALRVQQPAGRGPQPAGVLAREPGRPRCRRLHRPRGAWSA